ncbi:recombinase family protein [Enterobacter sp. UPMP2060]
MVLKLDRLSLSLKGLLLILEKIENTGADIYSIIENIDTSTPAGRMMQIVGSFAEFERSMLRGSTNSGLAAACLDGGLMGGAQNLHPNNKKVIVSFVT